jgi:hypothetical protein
VHNIGIIDAIVKAVVEKTGGVHNQIDFGNEQTALVKAS